MKDLNRRTAGELILLHNARCAAEDRIEGPWKRSKRELIGRIQALGEPDAARQPTCTTEKATTDNTKPETAGKQTVRALAEAFLTATDGAALTYGEIAARIREAMPSSGPTPQSIRWYATKMRKRGETGTGSPRKTATSHRLIGQPHRRKAPITGPHLRRRRALFRPHIYPKHIANMTITSQNWPCFFYILGQLYLYFSPKIPYCSLSRWAAIARYSEK